MRLAIVASHPIQHFCPLYRELAQVPDWQVRVFFASTAGLTPYLDRGFEETISWGSDLTAGFDHEFLPGATHALVDGAMGNAALGSRLRSFRPDALQSYGFHHGVARATYAYGRLHRRPAACVADSELLQRRSWPHRMRKRGSLPILLQLPRFFFTAGDNNERYYRSYGVAARRLVRSPLPIDSRALDQLRTQGPAVREMQRALWNVSETDIVLLVVGKLTARKSPLHVLNAIQALPRALRDSYVVVFAGAGAEAGALRALADSSDVRVITPGFVIEETLRRYYYSADLLVHPSAADPHPLAVAEAIYAGLPAIVSDRVGCVGPSDDLRPGVNGYDYPYGQPKKMADRLLQFHDRQLRRQFSLASLAIGRERSVAVSKQTYVAGFGRFL